MKKSSLLVILYFVFFILYCLPGFVHSQIPQTLSFQGVLKDAGGVAVPNGDYSLTFNLYPLETGGTSLWTETQTVSVVDGIFNVIQGSVNPLNVVFDVQYWLGITVVTGSELPRIRLTSAAYSLNAKSVEDTAITTAKIADEAVTQSKLAPGLSLPPGGAAGGDLTGTYPNPAIAENAVNSANIQDGTIQLTDLNFTPLSRPLSPGVATTEIADNAVTTPKIEDGAITQAKLSPGLSLPPGGTAGGDLSGTYPNPTIATNAVNSSKIQDGQVGSADVADNAVVTAKINDGAVTQAKIAAGVTLPPSGTAGGDLTSSYPNPTVDGIQGRAVASTAPGSGQVLKWSGSNWAPATDESGGPPSGAAGGDLTGTYPNPTIAGDAVTSAKILDSQVAAADLATSAVTTAKINDLAVSTAKIADGAVTQGKIAAGVTLPPSGTAGGDLSGTYPSPTVDGLQGRAVSSTLPTSGQVLEWNGSTWIPGTDDSGGTPSGPAGGDLTGTYPDPTIASNAINSSKIQDLQVASADIAAAAVTTAKIVDAAVTQAKIASGVTLPPSGTAGGDLSGTYPNPSVDGLQGRGVASTAPASGQVLKWNTTSNNWAPSADETGTSFWTASGLDIYSNNTGNVGIGTTTPGYKLQVVGDVQVGYTNAYRVGAYTGLSWNSSNGSINVGSPSSQPLQLLAGTSVPRVYINNVNGRVGVGTLNPAARIHATTPGRYAGYFSADSLSGNTHVIHSQYNGTGNYDAYGVYGYSRPADGWGYGGNFIGGYYGLVASGQGGAYSSAVYGIYGSATGTDGYRYGVYGYASTPLIQSAGAYGVYGYANGSYRNYGVYGYVGGGEIRYAGYFDGNVNVTGYVYKAGGSFKIDHPLDPENKYLYHSFVESPDMKNIYDGVVTLDDNGQAWVELPEWFGALNKDFRYQLTCIGGYAPVYISRKITENRFMISGGTPGLEVSWQVTGIRQDAYAQKNRLPVEELKRADERGLYLHPEAFGQPESRGLDYQLRKAAEDKKPQVK